MSQNTDPFPTPRGALSPEGVSARVPRDAWDEALAEPGVREALDRGLADVEAGRTVPLGVPGYAGAKGAVPEQQGPTTEAEQLRNWLEWAGKRLAGVPHPSIVDRIEAEARAAAPLVIGYEARNIDAIREALRAEIEKANLPAHPTLGPANGNALRVDLLTLVDRVFGTEARAAAPPDIDGEWEMLSEADQRKRVTFNAYMLGIEHGKAEAAAPPDIDTLREALRSEIESANLPAHPTIGVAAGTALRIDLLAMVERVTAYDLGVKHGREDAEKASAAAPPDIDVERLRIATQALQIIADPGGDEPESAAISIRRRNIASHALRRIASPDATRQPESPKGEPTCAD